MITFLKMHGLGNDFVIIDGRHQILTDRNEFSRKVAHRRFGVGADQVGFIDKSNKADAYLDMYNYDGSVVRSCGNMSRCVAHILMKELGKSRIVLETISGIIICEDAGGGLVQINMGQPRLNWKDLPLATEMDTLSLDLSGISYPSPVGVSMGNPHTVFFVPDAEVVPLETIGPQVERHPLYPDRTNVEFIKVIDKSTLRMRVWERGTGITLACGTGACAAAVAAVRRGLADRKVTVKLDGGNLEIEWREADNCVYMTGPVAKAFSGAFD